MIRRVGLGLPWPGETVQELLCRAGKQGDTPSCLPRRLPCTRPERPGSEAAGTVHVAHKATESRGQGRREQEPAGRACLVDGGL